MLKKAGIVVLGAAAGMMSLAPLASAGEAPARGDDHGRHHGHHSNRDLDSDNGCDSDASATLLNVSDIACDVDLGPVNAGGEQTNVNPGGDEDGGGAGEGEGDGGGEGGDAPAINVSNILENVNVDPINVLGDQVNLG